MPIAASALRIWAMVPVSPVKAGAEVTQPGLNYARGVPGRVGRHEDHLAPGAGPRRASP